MYFHFPWGETLWTNAYHLQTSGQTKCYNKTIVAPSHHYVAELQRTWDIFAQSQMYAYNTQVDHTTGTARRAWCSPANHPDPLHSLHARNGTCDGRQCREPLKVLRPRLAPSMAEMRHNADKRSEGAIQQYKRPHDPQDWEKHGCLSFSRYGLNVYCCAHPLRTKWPWKHIRNCSLAPLNLIVSWRRHRTPLLSSRTEFRALTL